MGVSESFVVITNPKDMSDPKIRLVVASHAAKLVSISRRQNHYKRVSTRPSATLHSFLSWRSSSTPVKPRFQKKPKSSSRGHETIALPDVAAEVKSVVCSIPASLNSGMSLQHCKSISVLSVCLWYLCYNKTDAFTSMY